MAAWGGVHEEEVDPKRPIGEWKEIVSVMYENVSLLRAGWRKEGKRKSEGKN